MSSRTVALAFVVILLAAIAVSATFAPGSSSRNPPAGGGLRAFGQGQIRFQGHGPEWWASRAHRLNRAYRGQAHTVVHLQRRLASRLSELVWLVQAFLCIHAHEGAWDDPGAPYWGGLQFDRDFMRAYGRELYRRKGTADRWTPSEQLAVAITAFQTRGFEPWPNTARACGLL